jgi:hypothetical protein
MTPQPQQYVTYVLFSEVRAALVQRIEVLERRAEALAGAQQVHAEIDHRVAALEQAARNHVTVTSKKRDRRWVIVIGVMTGIICPLIVTVLLSVLHLRNLG